MKRLHRRERGFTILELLITLTILGILAATIVPNVHVFAVTGKVAAANTELANVRTAAEGYFADNNAWPEDSSLLNGLLSGAPKGTYYFDAGNGTVTGATGWDGLTFDPSGQEWQPQS